VSLRPAFAAKSITCTGRSNEMNGDVVNAKSRRHRHRRQRRPAQGRERQRSQRRPLAESPRSRVALSTATSRPAGHLPGNFRKTLRAPWAFWVKVPKDAVSDCLDGFVGARRSGKLSFPAPPRSVGTAGRAKVRSARCGRISVAAMRSVRRICATGRWHHVAVFFAPGDAPEAPVQVKQYIGRARLESSTITLTPGQRRGPTANSANPAAGANDIVWLGCRLTGKQPERFPR